MVCIDEGQVNVESLAHLSNFEAAQKIAEHFAAISNEYSPIDNTQLPSFLPALPPPRVEDHDVFAQLNRLKKTRSTLPIDIPEKIRKECSHFLDGPLTDIINSSPAQSQYPAVWKQGL